MSLTTDNPRAIVGGNKPPLAEVLADQFAELTGEIEGIAALASDAPKKIETDTAFGKIGDIVKEARKLTKRLDDARDTEQRPHLEAKRTIDGFFKGHMERLSRIADVLQERADAYTQAKAAAARREREAEARRQAEEAERQRQIAARQAEANRPTAAAKHAELAERADDRAAEATAAAHASNADLTRVRSSGGTVASGRTEWDFEIIDYAAVSLETLRPYIARAEVEKALRSYVRVNKGAAPLAGVRIFEKIKANFR